MNVATFRAHKGANLPAYCRLVDADCPLDRHISYAVKVLRDAGVETYESCQGGNGHSFPEPTVRFSGPFAEGFRALSVAVTFGLPVRDLRRVWTLTDGEPTGPQWELTFYRRPLARLQREVERSGRLT